MQKKHITRVYCLFDKDEAFPTFPDVAPRLLMSRMYLHFSRGTKNGLITKLHQTV